MPTTPLTQAVAQAGDPALALSPATTTLAGVLLLSIVTIEWGGTFLLSVVRGKVAQTDFQRTFARAGHAHAGVLVTLSLVCALLADATALDGVADTVARSGVPAAALLMPAGFFLSSLGRGRDRPNRLVVLIWAGAVSLAGGVVTLGVGLLALA